MLGNLNAVAGECTGVVIGSSNDMAAYTTGKGIGWHLNTVDLRCTWYDLSEKKVNIYQMKEQLTKLEKTHINGTGPHRIDYLVIGLDGWIIVDGTGDESGANVANFVQREIWENLPSTTHLITTNFPKLDSLNQNWIPDRVHADKQTQNYNNITNNIANVVDNWSTVSYADNYPNLDGIHPTQEGRRHIAIEIMHAIFQQEDR
jgi:lysophospholipase L1-like esterase